ncbi:uncharacterized protein LOC130900184 [Diorhabda carinulata]|uniref:uncharacterized protein LOC130900184 n=1 Tax=Diorhabda carinulata TaxID=1163345 RepID=UPI0025A16707|nr:uncharacterized protein LOC130900184 [Diorhabda carinulata]
MSKMASNNNSSISLTQDIGSSKITSRASVRPSNLDLSLKSNNLEIMDDSIPTTPLLEEREEASENLIAKNSQYLDANQNSTNTVHSESPNYCSRLKSHVIPINSPPSGKNPKNLMESILVAKMEQASLGHPGRQLVRTDSADSASSFGSVNSQKAGDVCRCDDCLLGIGDYWQQDNSEEKRRKVSTIGYIRI